MKNVYVYVHSHWDREWYREFEEFRLRLIEVVDDVIDKLMKDEFPCFYFDGQTAALEDYLEMRPEKKGIIEKLIAQKKLYIGPFYCSADSFLTSAEFMLRNLFFGINYSKNFNCNEYIGYLSDTFGHSASMPNILKSCGIESAMLWRGLGELSSEFIWKDIKATYLIQGYFQDFLSCKLNYPQKAELLKAFIDKIAARSSEDILLPCGADHLKVAENLQEQIKEINKYLKDYRLMLSQPFEYLEKVKNNYISDFDGEFLNPSKNFLLKGVYSSRIYQKQLNAKTQWELSRIAEPLATIASAVYALKNRQAELDYAYKTLIKNHAHDSIYGCSIDEVHKDVQGRFEHVEQVSLGIKNRVLRDLSDNFSDESKNLSFINLSNFDYSGVVEFETEKKLGKKYNVQLLSKYMRFPDKKLYEASEIPITEDITTVYKYVTEVKNLLPFSMSSEITETEPSVKITEKSIENSFVALKVSKNSIMLEDKVSNKIYSNFLEIVNRADVGDSYTFGPLKGDKPIVAKLIGSKIKVVGKIKNTLRLVYEILIPKRVDKNYSQRSKTTIKHKIFVDVTLSNLADYLSFEVEWENKSKNHILQLKFNNELPITTTVSEDMLGAVKREFDPDYNIYDHIPAPRGVELKTNTAPFQRFVWAQNLGVVTKGLNEYEVYKNSLYVTLLRATELISQPKNPARGTPAGPPLLCPDLQCLGKQRAEFAIKFTKSPQDLYKTAEMFYGSVVPLFVKDIIGFDRLFETGNPNILVQAMRFDKSRNSVILRLVNISDKEEPLSFVSDMDYKNITVVDSLEENPKQCQKNIKVPARDIITLELSK